ncbi:hypothetical protein KHA80_12860 [Anaerobacillus sp. HL2]|nr:hypothetical protein KHA80_12860 [Anaerobacillus sp. HL2]
MKEVKSGSSYINYKFCFSTLTPTVLAEKVPETVSILSQKAETVPSVLHTVTVMKNKQHNEGSKNF